MARTVVLDEEAPRVPVEVLDIRRRPARTGRRSPSMKSAIAYAGDRAVEVEQAHGAEVVLDVVGGAEVLAAELDFVRAANPGDGVAELHVVNRAYRSTSPGVPGIRRTR